MTPVEDFYRIDTSLAPPAIEPGEWRLRIHGLVERELDLGFDDGNASWWLEADGDWTPHHRDADGRALADVQALQIALHQRRRDRRLDAQSRSAG